MIGLFFFKHTLRIPYIYPNITQKCSSKNIRYLKMRNKCIDSYEKM